ncbi:MAG: MarR family transcriptional regulator [Thermotaleaceae bacterium]
MGDKNLKEINQGLMEFSALFHRKFGHVFHSSSQGEHTFTKSQNKTMMILGDIEKITPTLLGKCLDMKKGSLTTLLDGLEAMDMIYRQPDEGDRRKTWIQLTDKGKEYMLAKRAEIEKTIMRSFSSFEEEEIEAFAMHIKAIVATMSKIEGEMGK